ncbi:integrase core domain-containing protein [Bordetella avium]|uniref:integrase core domain-containing protein n=1 Tax=Bordetella avium TaxID=521 RepID=UPI0013E31FC9
MIRRLKYQRFNRTLCSEWRLSYQGDDLDRVERAAEPWMWSCNHERPNRALGEFTPKAAVGHDRIAFLLLAIAIKTSFGSRAKQISERKSAWRFLKRPSAP